MPGVRSLPNLTGAELYPRSWRTTLATGDPLPCPPCGTFIYKAFLYVTPISVYFIIGTYIMVHSLETRVIIDGFFFVVVDRDASTARAARGVIYTYTF